jgi:putative ABC transport system substrate-binding protein
LVDLQPDIILSYGTPSTAALQRATRTIPIVFANVNDPVGSGFVAGLASPGGNITGFINIEAGLAGKWMELLTEIAPGLKRAAIMFNPDTFAASAYMPSFEAEARSLKIKTIPTPIRSDIEIETVITSLGREAALLSCRITLRCSIARQSYRWLLDSTYRRCILQRPFLETAVCSPTESTG